MGTVYVVISGGWETEFLGCFEKLEDATVIAKKYLGATIFKCDLHGRKLECQAVPHLYEIVFRKYEQAEEIVGRVVGFENAKRYICEYATKTYPAPNHCTRHDRHTYVMIEIYTSKIVNGVQIGGFYVGRLTTRIAEYRYEDPEMSSPENAENFANSSGV